MLLIKIYCHMFGKEMVSKAIL